MADETPKQKIIVYVDGHNFYFGLKSKGWRKFYWLDIVAYFESLVKSHQEVVEVNYFSATPLDQAKYDRQDLFFSANRLNPKFKLHLGKYMAKNRKCWNCGHSHVYYEEKETDVRIAVKMIEDVINSSCDISILVSADSDLVPPIEYIRSFNPRHRIFVYFPPARYSSNLAAIANNTKKLEGDPKSLQNAVLSEKIQHPNGYVIQRPAKWV